MRPTKLLLSVSLAVPLWGCTRDVDLQGGLSERQANEVVLALRESGLAADKRDSGRPGQRLFAVRVARPAETQALRVLRDRGLPRVAAPAEVERPGGVLPLPEEQRLTRAREDAAALAQTLEALPEVQEARVHLALPPEELLPPSPADAAAGNAGAEGPARRPSAAVVLRLRAASDAAQLSGRVQQLVAHAIPGLRVADVVVAVAPPLTALAGAAPCEQAGLLCVAPASRPLAVAVQALLLLCSAALVLLTGALRAARAPRPPAA